MFIMHPGKYPNRLDGLQSTSRTKQLTESEGQSIVLLLQTNVTSHGMQSPDIYFPLLATTAIQQMLQQGCLQVRGQRPLHDVRWNAEVMLIWHRSQSLLCACQRQRLYAAGRSRLSSSTIFLFTWPTKNFCS
jgi:hypothetical protein